MRPRRGYQEAARTQAIDTLHPGRRDDARQLGETVLRSDTHGVRRDWLAWHYMLDPQGPGWSDGRFKAALFYAYGCGWVTFIGWVYVVDPGPALRGLASPSPACRLDHGQGATGTDQITGQITSTTTGNKASTIQTKLADFQSPQ